MKKMVIFSLILLLLSFPGKNFSQQVISAAGTHATGTSVQLSWTVGECMTETFTAGSHVLTQGFHQGNLTVTAIDPVDYPGLELTVYPNPVSTSLKLEITGDKLKNLSFRLYDMDGKAMLTGKAESNPVIIKMEPYAAGIYLLKVFRDANQSLKTFTIVKN